MTQPPGDAGLVRALGVVGVAASIVNITIGGGIFRAPGTMEVTGRLGAAAPLAYIVCAIAMAFVVLCFAEAGSRVSLTGGPYAYVERAFGVFAGFVVGWLLWVTGTIATAAVATIYADALQRMVPAFSSPAARVTMIAAVFVVVTALNVRGVKFGAGLNVAATVAKLAPLALLIVVGLFHLEPANLEWESTPTVSDLGRASVFLIFAFAGIESAMVPSGEVREPARTVPRAVILALVIVTVFYLLIQIVSQGVLGDTLAGRSSPLADVAGAMMGPWGAMLLGSAIVVSTFGYLSGMILAIPRALFAFARDGILPRALASVHPRYRTPWIAIIVQSAIAFALALRNPFERLAMLANISALSVYLGCAAAAWRLRTLGVADDTTSTLRPLPGSRLAPPLTVLVIVALLTSVTLDEWIISGLTVLVGLALYFVARLRDRAAGRVRPARDAT